MERSDGVYDVFMNVPHTMFADTSMFQIDDYYQYNVMNTIVINSIRDNSLFT